METHLQNQTVVATDATTTSTNGKQTYIRNISDKDTVVYYGLEKKSGKELDEMLNADSEASTHLVDLLTSIRSDELEKQLLDESEEYQNCIKEEENSEEEVKRKAKGTGKVAF